MTKTIELFGVGTEAQAADTPVDWASLVTEQPCPFLHRTCIKVRKSQPEIAIGTCTVGSGKNDVPTIICPHRLLERRQIFTDCLHLLTSHEPGNELHVVSEVQVPGGNVDYFLISATGLKVRDFVGVELQTLDTTGTVWPARQRFLQSKGLEVSAADVGSTKPFGINWKMTAKTILIQLHHKVDTFEHINKKLALVVQDSFLEYMRREFRFEGINPQAPLGDPMHIHAYGLEAEPTGNYKLVLRSRSSTDSAGISASLGLQAEAKVELKEIVAFLEAKMSGETVFTPA